MNASPSSAAAVLEVRDLRTYFRGETGLVKAVDGVSFTLGRGQIMGVVGESGSGKSVTALSIMGLTPRQPGVASEGEILFGGRNLRACSEEEMRRVRGNRIAMIFQDPMTSLNPVLTIGRQITEALRLHKGLSAAAAGKRTADLLAMVGIPRPAERLDDYPHQFSGGMRQRVMIAMALSCDPELLIADEPTTALDVTIQAQILEILTRIKEELGTSIIMITHDLGVVARMADYVLVMYAGRVVEEAATDELFANPRMPYTIGLLRSRPPMESEAADHLTPIRGAPPNLANLPPGCPFMPRCDYAVAGRCAPARPELRPVGADHRAACLFDITLQTPARAAPLVV